MKSSQVKSNFTSILLKLPFKILFSRFTLALLSLGIQIAFIIFCYLFLERYMLWVFGGSALLGLILTILIINRTTNPTFQISWIILILLFPTFGVYIYLFVKLQIGVQAFSRRYQQIRSEMTEYLKQDVAVYSHVQKKDTNVLNYVTYMNQVSGYPTYENSSVHYYSVGEKMFPEMLEDLKNAKKYIFLEYFIVSKGIMWNSILNILKEKVQEGVEVYFMYDGTCSFMLLPHDYPDIMESYGIHTRVFNPVVPIISTHYNNRDHRKILVIDGVVAYTGGINLADEYINQEERFGVWKDTAIRVSGDAVRSFVLLFLENWNALSKVSISYEPFLASVKSVKGTGFVLPYGDNPLDSYVVGQFSYTHMLHTAKRYVHIITPYLIIDYEVLKALCDAARSGVDVKIIMPGIPDKKMIYYIGRTYYKALLEAGVGVYEYTPGFTHAKMFVSDDEKAIVGTINLDFRSLYLHFENAVYVYQNEEVAVMESDYQKTLAECRSVTLESLKKYPFWKTLIGKILRVFAPLL